MERVHQAVNRSVPFSNNRLAPNGALIQGAGLTLIAGKNLTNAGTLKATNNLSAIAGQDMVSSGLMQTGGDLICWPV